MTPGQVVLIDWRDALAGSGEPNKRRPAILVGSPRFFGTVLPFELVIPLTGDGGLAIPHGSLEIPPDPENGCTKLSYALSWAVQCVPHARITQTNSRITDEQLRTLRMQIAACVGMP